MKKILLSALALAFTCSVGLFTSNVNTFATEASSLTLQTNGGTEYEVTQTNGNQGVNLPTPEKYGCEFLGWYSNPDFTGEELTGFYIPNGNETVYAKWSTPNYPTVSFETNGGTTYQDVTYTGDAIVLPTPERLDYTFGGWYESSACTGAPLSGEYNPTQSVTLYAKWTAVVYPTVTFFSNGGTEYSATSSNSVGITLPTPIREGFNFNGWFTDVSCDAEYKVEGLFKPDQDTNLYAYWTAKNKYTLSFNTNGGLTVPSVTDYEGTQVTLPTAEKYGYRFDGWYKESSLTTAVGTTDTLSANTTYYAKWTAVKYLYLYRNCANEYDRLEFVANSTVTIADLPIPKDYVKANVNCPFVRWIHEDGTTATDFTITDHSTLIAEYGNVPVLSHVTDNGNGTYTTKTSGKSIYIFEQTTFNVGTYSFDMTFNKGGGGAQGLAFRMTHSGRDYAYEDNGTGYIAAVIGPTSGALDVSKVIDSGSTSSNWNRIAQTELTSLPSAWQTKFSNASTGAQITVNLKVMSFSDGFAIYIDNDLAYTYVNATVLAPFTGTGWGMRNSTTNYTTTFSNISVSEMVTNFNKLTDSGNGTYTTSNNTIAQMYTANTQSVTYSGTFAIKKDNSGGVGLAFRMNLGSAMYPYETTGAKYISAVYVPANGNLQVSMVDGDYMTYENSSAKFFQLRGVNCKNTTELSPIALTDLPSAWQTKYNGVTSGDMITTTMKIIDYGTYFEVYIDNALSFTVTDEILSHFTDTGLGVRSSSSGATISNLSYTENQTAQIATANQQIALIPNKEEN